MTLRAYLLSRSAAIEAEIKVLEVELAEIRVAQAAISGEADAIPSTPIRRRRRPTTVRDGSIKAWILRVLAEFEPDGGLVTDDVIHAVEAMGGPEVLRNSMTPQLSRLKANGVITQQGRRWKLAPPAAADLDDDPLADLLPVHRPDLKEEDLLG